MHWKYTHLDVWSDPGLNIRQKIYIHHIIYGLVYSIYVTVSHAFKKVNGDRVNAADAVI